MEIFDVVVVGGGAAGICAAIQTARNGKNVLVCEKMNQIGKKILATGNGRCNLMNDNFNESFYNYESGELVKSVFNRLGKKEILGFFHALNLETYSQDGRVFPVTNQATSVLKVLEMELQKLRVPIEYNCSCTGLTFSENTIIINTDDGKCFNCRKVIITGGGKSYPVLGSDGSVYEIARKLGHEVVEPVPSAVPLIVKDSLCHQLQGQRINAAVRAIIQGRISEEVSGELLFTKYGFSGTCILDISEPISIAINREQRMNVLLAVDMVPFLTREELTKKLSARKKAKIIPEEILIGILPNKLSFALKGLLENGDIESAVNILKDYRFKVTGTKTWTEAEFTAGGIDIDEINPLTLESKLRKGVYFAGEVLNVNGKRGGYNLGWAWASGLLAGQTL